jgi:hypothetical protein
MAIFIRLSRDLGLRTAAGRTSYGGTTGEPTQVILSK